MNYPHKTYPHAPHLDRDDKHYGAILNTMPDELRDLRLEIKRYEGLIKSFSEILVKTVKETGNLHHSTNLKAINEISHQVNLKIESEGKKLSLYNYSYHYQKTKKKFTTKLDKTENKKESDNKEEGQELKNEAESTATTS